MAAITCMFFVHTLLANYSWKTITCQHLNENLLFCEQYILPVTGESVIK